MARISTSTTVRANQDHAWSVVSDLSRYSEWLSMLEAWRGEVPDQLSEGVELTAVVGVKGFRNRMTWTVSSWNPPRTITLSGRGKGGVTSRLTITIDPRGGGCAIAFDTEFSAPGMIGPLGMGVARVLKGDMNASLKRLAALIDAA